MEANCKGINAVGMLTEICFQNLNLTIGLERRSLNIVRDQVHLRTYYSQYKLDLDIYCCGGIQPGWQASSTRGETWSPLCNA